MKIRVCFYSLNAYDRSNIGTFAWLRCWVTSRWHRFVHVNAQIGPVFYDFSSGGARYFLTYAEPTAAIDIEVDPEAAERFIAQFAERYFRRESPFLWLQCALGGYLPVINCSRFLKVAYGGERTPDRLHHKLLRLVGSTASTDAPAAVDRDCQGHQPAPSVEA